LSCSWREELISCAVLKTQSSREAWILNAGADVHTLRWIEAMTLSQDDAKPGERFAAPARRRTSTVRAVVDVDRDVQ
jgi:hypothetical protein